MKSKSTAMTTALFICLLAAVVAIGATAQTKQPNLTGTWKMNAEKSKFEQGGPSEITIKFDHKDAALSETLTIATGNGDHTLETKYSTDGKETTQEVIGGRQAKTSAKWEGETLIIAWKAEDGGFTRKITLSPDGKTMTMIVMQSDSDGKSSTDTVVLEKQETKK
ncbi:MAG: hypothetical protein ABIP14_07330 [Blastocatellia bacterium]